MHVCFSHHIIQIHNSVLVGLTVFHEILPCIHIECGNIRVIICRILSIPQNIVMNPNNIMIPLEKHDITNLYKIEDPCILRHHIYGAARRPPPTTHLPSPMIWMWGGGGSRMYVCE
jgi:hypothetical protein